jgi:hypothetical protein
VLKKLLGSRGRLAALAGASAVMLFASALISPAAAEARPGGPENLTRPASILGPWISPNPEKSEYGKWTQQQATDWVNNCPSGRFCTWIRDGEYYTMFQLYKCGVYALDDWYGTTNFFNNQNVNVQILDSRHAVRTTESPGLKFITNWDTAWYINLCA